MYRTSRKVSIMLRKTRVTEKPVKPGERDELISVLPVNALESLSALHLNGQVAGSFGLQESIQDLTGAAVGRREFMNCIKRSAWKDSVAIHLIHAPS